MNPCKIIAILGLALVSCHNQTNGSDQKHNDSINPSKSLIVSDSSGTGLTNDFMKFWTKFRTAVLNFDTTQVIELTGFPFQTRGTFDSDPIIDYNRRNFIRVFKAFLNQQAEIKLDESDKNLSAITEFDYIRKTQLPNKNDIQDNYARIGDFVFGKSNNTWKFVFAYLNDDILESLEK